MVLRDLWGSQHREYGGLEREAFNGQLWLYDELSILPPIPKTFCNPGCYPQACLRPSDLQCLFFQR